MKEGTEVELCAVPRMARAARRGDGGVCQPVLGALVVLRAGIEKTSEGAN